MLNWSLKKIVLPDLMYIQVHRLIRSSWRWAYPCTCGPRSAPSPCWRSPPSGAQWWGGGWWKGFWGWPRWSFRSSYWFVILGGNVVLCNFYFSGEFGPFGFYANYYDQKWKEQWFRQRTGIIIGWQFCQQVNLQVTQESSAIHAKVGQSDWQKSCDGQTDKYHLRV